MKGLRAGSTVATSPADDEDNGGDGESPLGLSDVWIFVAAPAAAYVGAAMFVAGYNFYFGLPGGVFAVDTVASVFDAARSYASVVLQHGTPESLLAFAFFVYLAALPQRFYGRWSRVILLLALAAVLLSFTLRPFVWAAVVGIAFALMQLLPETVWRLQRRGAARDEPASRFAVPLGGALVKAVSIVMFFFATLFATGYEAARFERQFYVTDGEERNVVLAIAGTTMVTAPLFDRRCKAVTAEHFEEPLEHFYFDDDLKVYTLGDADTPAFHLYDTSGLKSKSECGRRRAPVVTWTSRLFL